MINLHNEKNQLAKFFLCKINCGEKSAAPCAGCDVKTASYLNVIAFCEGKKWKNKLLLKEQKLSAVNQGLM